MMRAEPRAEIRAFGFPGEEGPNSPGLLRVLDMFRRSRRGRSRATLSGVGLGCRAVASQGVAHMIHLEEPERFNSSSSSSSPASPAWITDVARSLQAQCFHGARV